MPTRIWMESVDVFSATVMHILSYCKSIDDATCDGICFEKESGFTSTELLKLNTNFPRTIVEYPDGIDFVRNPKLTSVI